MRLQIGLVGIPTTSETARERRKIGLSSVANSETEVTHGDGPIPLKIFFSLHFPLGKVQAGEQDGNQIENEDHKTNPVKPCINKPLLSYWIVSVPFF